MARRRELFKCCTKEAARSPFFFFFSPSDVDVELTRNRWVSALSAHNSTRRIFRIFPFSFTLPFWHILHVRSKARGCTNKPPRPIVENVDRYGKRFVLSNYSRCVIRVLKFNRITKQTDASRNITPQLGTLTDNVVSRKINSSVDNQLTTIDTMMRRLLSLYILDYFLLLDYLFTFM